MVHRGATDGLPIVLDGALPPIALPLVAHSGPPRGALHGVVQARCGILVLGAGSCFAVHQHPSRRSVRTAAYVSSARSEPYGLTADDFVGSRWDIRGATAHGMQRLRDENPPETHKKRRTEALEVPTDLRHVEILLEDMGDVIVLTGL